MVDLVSVTVFTKVVLGVVVDLTVLVTVVGSTAMGVVVVVKVDVAVVFCVEVEVTVRAGSVLVRVTTLVWVTVKEFSQARNVLHSALTLGARRMLSAHCLVRPCGVAGGWPRRTGSRRDMSMRRDPAASEKDGKRARTHSDRSAHMPAVDERKNDGEMIFMILCAGRQRGRVSSEL